MTYEVSLYWEPSGSCLCWEANTVPDAQLVPYLPSIISHSVLLYLEEVLVKGSVTTPAIPFEDDNTAAEASLLC